MGESIDGMGKFGRLYARNKYGFQVQGGCYCICECPSQLHVVFHFQRRIGEKLILVGGEAGMAILCPNSQRAQDPI